MWRVLCVLYFLFSIHKIVRPADADKIANLAQHPKSLGTAALSDQKYKYVLVHVFCNGVQSKCYAAVNNPDI